MNETPIVTVWVEKESEARAMIGKPLAIMVDDELVAYTIVDITLGEHGIWTPVLQRDA